MTLQEILKGQNLTDEQINKVVAAMKENKIYFASEDGLDEKYQKQKEELDSIQGQLKSANKTITDLKKSNTDNDELQRKIKEHEDTIKTQKNDYESKIKALTINTAIGNMLRDNNAKHPELLATKFDMDKLSITDKGEVIGLNEQLKLVKEQYKDLFDVKLSGPEPNNKGKSTEQSNSGAFSFLNIITENQVKRS